MRHKNTRLKPKARQKRPVWRDLTKILHTGIIEARSVKAYKPTPERPQV
uniref:Uncharacterized protein n=1 Tax=Siphoviridae sp. ct1SN28 TaxID=2825308 RepID=A0A8S5TRP8_9CAUD|nr:MAG TPA: hypothetical protein [Siphoviridae sp. ct1SN28]